MKKIPALKVLSSAVLSKATGSPRIIKVTDYISYRCNLACSFCKRKDERTEELPAHEIKAMMREFKSAGACVWTFNGGEPLLRDDIGALIDYGNSLGFYTTLVTNGTLAAKRIEEIKNVCHADVSMDGDEKTHDNIRGKGAFKRAVEGINAFRSKNISTHLMMVVTKENIGLTDFVITLAEKYGCAAKFQPIHTHSNDKNDDTIKYFPSPDEMRRTFKQLMSEKKKGRPIVSSYGYLKTVAEHWPDKDHSIKCAAGINYCYITPNGNMTPCCGKVLEIEKEVNRAQDKPYVSALKTLPDMKKCRDCYYSGPLELNLNCSLSPSILAEQFKNIFIKEHY